MSRTKEKVPEVNRRGEKTEEQSNTKATLYKAPHARTAITSCANWRYKGIRTYSRIPLYLRKDVPIRTPQNTCTDNRNDSNAVKNGRVTVNPPPIQTCVGRQVHTPARFLQLVHAVIAPNDIYYRPSARFI